jgi:hypothetical protein
MKVLPPKSVRIGSSVPTGKNIGVHVRGRQVVKM